MRRSILRVGLVFFLLAGVCHGGEEAPRARALAVFKNGLAFVIRTAEVSLRDGWGEIAFVPKAALGSFWLFPSSPQAYVEAARAGWRKERTERECLALAELIRVNAGARVRLHLAGGLAAVEGELLAMAGGDEKESDLPLVHVRTRGEGVTTLPVDQVRSIEWPAGCQRRIAEERTSKVLHVKIRNGVGREAVHMAYLSRGVSWLPGYWLDVRDAEKARIMLKATLLNDLEDFQDLEISFVVGFPSFLFSHLTSPMNLEENVENFLARLSGRPVAAEGFANVMTQAVGRGAFPADGVSLEPGADIESAGQGAEDLFFFSQKQVTLRKGERSEHVIFSTQVPYGHIFECSLNDISGVDEWGNQRGRDDRERGSKPPVWHCLKLTNTSQYPWTTAPALVMKGEVPLAQNQLNYLARGASGLLRLTYAPDIAVQQGEEETGRRDDVVVNRRRYTEVQAQGAVSLRNHKGEPVKMEVSKTLSGMVLSASDVAKTSRLTDEIRGVNPQSQIRWNFTLAPGEAKKLTYAYKVYVN